MRPAYGHRHRRCMVRRGGCAASTMRSRRWSTSSRAAVVAGQRVEPTLPGSAVDDAIGMAQLIRRTVLAIGRRRPAQQRHGDLRAEAGRQPQGVAHRIGAAARQVEHTQLGVGLAVVGHRRHEAGLQHLHGHHVLDAGTHGVAREALGVGDHDALGRRTEHMAQRADLGRSRAAARRRVGLVRDEDRWIRPAWRAARRAPRPGAPPPPSPRRCVPGRAGCRGRPSSWSPRPAPRRSACRPRSRAASADSTTSAAAPMPTIMPWRRRSNGVAASSTLASVAAAPLARKPLVIHGISASPVASSAATTMTRRQRPARIQSSASASACVVDAQAALTCVFGPRAPISSANCEWPMASTRNRNRRSKS